VPCIEASPARRARLVRGGRWHLDWNVARLGGSRTRIAEEVRKAREARPPNMIGMRHRAVDHYLDIAWSTAREVL
jgi:hypothetical protein